MLILCIHKMKRLVETKDVISSLKQNNTAELLSDLRKMHDTTLHFINNRSEVHSECEGRTASNTHLALPFVIDARNITLFPLLQIEHIHTICPPTCIWIKVL